VEGAESPQDADHIARTIAESPLVKTALHGATPTGRILAAVGRSGIAIDIDRVTSTSARCGWRKAAGRAPTTRATHIAP